MKLTTADLEKLSHVAIDAACEAGAMIQDSASHQIDVLQKSSEQGAGTSRASQVLTAVDLRSQEIVLKHILPICDVYDLGLLAEEGEDNGSRFEKDYFWCIDPLDGTLPFIESRPGYAVSIALVSRAGQPVIGVVYDPRDRNLYHAVSGGGAFRNHKRWDGIPAFTEPYSTIDSGGAVMNVCWILENDKDSAYYCKNPKPQDGGGCLWDYAATACLFTELGAAVSDVYGDPLDLNRRDSTFMNLKGVLYAASQDISGKFLR